MQQIMQKITSLLTLLAIVATVSRGQDTDNLETGVEYLIMNGNGYWMTKDTHPTKDVTKAGRFTFHKSSKSASDGEPYEIKSVSRGAWLSYSMKTSYDNTSSFVSFESSQSKANHWSINFVSNGDGELLGSVYQIRPYKNLLAKWQANKYLNWYGGVDSNVSNTVGLYEGDAETDAGSAWILVNPNDANNISEVRDKYYTWKQNNSVVDGVNSFGRYTIKDASALAEVESELNDAGNVVDAYTAKNKCMECYGEQIGFTVGKYYRIRNTKYQSDGYEYVGIENSTLNMQCKTNSANDPTLIWQYVQEGSKYYLKSAYCGLYPQELATTGGKTIIGAKNESVNFTYSLPSESNDGNFPCTLYLKGQKLWATWNGLISGANNSSVTATDTHHIEEVSAPSDAICKDWYQSNKLGLMDTPAKIDYDESVDVVISPNEFASPAEINKHIDILASYNNPQTMQDVHQTYNFFLNSYSSTEDELNPYVEAVNNYGALISVPYTAKAEWGTIILPFKAKIPEGWTMNTCASIAENKLVLEAYTTRIEQNIPYIVAVAGDKVGTTYQFIGYSNGAGTGIHSQNVLRGVLEDGAEIPVGGYMLARHKPTGKVGFVRVAEAYPIAKHKCYVTMESESSESASRYNTLFFEDTETGIDEVTGATQNDAVIYNMVGQRMSRMQRGLNIVGGRIVLK